MDFIRRSLRSKSGDVGDEVDREADAAECWECWLFGRLQSEGNADGATLRLPARISSAAV